MTTPEGPKNGPPVKYGVSDPLSLQEPSENDIQLSERMTLELEAEFPAETPEGMLIRQGVLRELETMFFDWMLDLGKEAGVPEQESRKSMVKVMTLGSYRLGVVHPGSDIDTLCIAPPGISREQFFNSFADRLQKHPDISECVPIPDAYTPIIKLKMRGVCIDLLFARLAKLLPEGESPEEAVKEDDVLKNMDDKSVRCMNGFRVADQILSLVPNQDTFRKTLRFVKYWARRRGIYSNILGFFGGIAWSLMVARVCQLYPYYAPSQLVSKFFWFGNNWDWKKKPVQLCEIIDPETVPGMSNFKAWNPRTNPSDGLHLMPVITPAFPAMNSTYNVTETTKRILLDEFKRGLDVVRAVEQSKAEWSAVHEPFPFFQNFKNFLHLEVLAKNEDVYQKFSGWVESRLRVLIMQLETVPGMQLHPNPLQYDLSGSDPDWPNGCGMFLAITFPREAGPTAAIPGQKIDLRSAVTQFISVVDQYSDRALHAGQFKLKLRRICSSDLPDYVLNPEAVQLKQARKRAADAALDGRTKRPRGGPADAGERRVIGPDGVEAEAETEE